MTIQEVLLPLFLEVILTFALLFCQVRLRGAFFGVSALVLAIMWLIYIVEILTSPWV